MMRSRFTRSRAAFAGAFVVGLMTTSQSHAASCQSGIIGVERVVLRQRPSVLAEAVSLPLPFGTKVTIVQDPPNGSFCEVKSPKGQTGWLPKSAMARQAKSALYAAGQGGAVDVKDSEVASAGKGFSEEFESAYKKGNSAANFKQVDGMESRLAPPDSVMRFAIEGGLAR